MCGGYFPLTVTWPIYIYPDGTGSLDGLDLNPAYTTQDSTGWQVGTYVYPLTPVPGCDFFADAAVQYGDPASAAGIITVFCNDGSSCTTDYLGPVGR